MRIPSINVGVHNPDNEIPGSMEAQEKQLATAKTWHIALINSHFHSLTCSSVSHFKECVQSCFPRGTRVRPL